MGSPRAGVPGGAGEDKGGLELRGRPCHSLSPSLGVSGYFRETIRQDIRRARERFSGPQLRQELARLQRRLDSVELLSPDIIMNLLLSYRDVQVCGARRGRPARPTSPRPVSRPTRGSE